jgi:hypothetical protein
MVMHWSFVLPLVDLFDIRPRQLAPMSEQQAINAMANPAFAFSPTWSILGPFQIGTRGSSSQFFEAPNLIPGQKRHGVQIR